MASDEVQPVTAHQLIEGELLNELTTSNEQILNLISPTHLPDEENFDADSLLVAVGHEHEKYIENCCKFFQERRYIASSESEEDVENTKRKGQENLEETLSRDGFNPQLLCTLERLSFDDSDEELGIQKEAAFVFTSCGPGPYEIEEYTFLCGGKDKRWIEQFSQKVNVVAEDQLIQEVNIIIELCCVGKGRRQLDFDEEIQELLRSFRKKRRWAVLVTKFSEVISKDGTTIEKVLEAFEEWKVNVRERRFQICFEEYHDRLLQTG